MTDGLPTIGESMCLRGGRIPDHAGDAEEGGAAFVLSGPQPSRIPVLIAVPHAGRAYPPALLDSMRDPEAAATRLEDRHADRLAQAVAAQTGAMLLIAHAPRAMIDLNRAPDDIDWDMIEGGGSPEEDDRFAPSRRTASCLNSRRARSGLGLIPRRLPGHGELWTRRHGIAELKARVDMVHAPYHACLEDGLERLRARWGSALLLDLHSMPSLPSHAGAAPARFVVGDRFGASCDGRLVAESFAFFAEHGDVAAHNRPYAGGYVLERHGRPRIGAHALQLEIDRASYLDRLQGDLGDGFAETTSTLSALVTRLARITAELANPRHGGQLRSGGWAEAAE